MAARFSFPKERRLCSVKIIKGIFAGGKRYKHNPLMVYYSLQEGVEAGPRCQILANAPKKLFKRAVDRNRIKRQIREAFRKQYPAIETLLEEKRTSLRLICVYCSHERVRSEILENCMHTLLAHFRKVLEKSGPAAHSAAH